MKPAPSSSVLLNPLSIPTDCWKSVSLDFMFGMPPVHKGRTVLVVFSDRLSKTVRLAPCTTKILGKAADFFFLDHVYRLHEKPESIVSDRDPRFTSGFWRDVFELLGIKLHISTADHPQTDVQTERANRVVADVLRTIATLMEWINTCRSWISLLITVFTPVRLKHHFMSTDCVIFGRQSPLCVSRVLVGEGTFLRSEKMRKSMILRQCYGGNSL